MPDAAGIGLQSPRQLKRSLALRLSVAATSISLLTGSVVYFMGIHQGEQAALERAIEGVRHFESPSMQAALLETSTRSHPEIERLLDPDELIGIRVLSSSKALLYESWAEAASSAQRAISLQAHEWPALHARVEHWVSSDNERQILIVLPLSGLDGALSGYVEGVYRFDASRLKREVWRSVLLGMAAVFGTSALLFPIFLAMLKQAARQSRRILNANLSLLHALGSATAKRDSDTDQHNYRVTLYAVALAEKLGLPYARMADLIVGSFLHDVGKIGIPDAILLKNGKLDSAEFEVMKRHPLLGLEIVAGNPWLTGAAAVIRSHHEHFDGGGYPDGLSGNDIPILARIFAVVDVFDALTSERPYKTAMDFNTALSIIKRDAGTHFDPGIVAVFEQASQAWHAQTACLAGDALSAQLRACVEKYFVTA